MILVPTYRPSLVSSLPDIEDRVEGGKHFEDLIALGDIIMRYGVHSTVGVVLLHKHYRLDPDERIIRTLTSSGLHTRAERYAGQDLIPYAWCLDDTTARGGFYPIEFIVADATCSHIRSDATRLEASRAFLSTFAAVLQDRRVEGIFGLSTLASWRLPGKPVASLLYEQTDQNCRVSYLTEVTRSVDVPLSSVNTVWAFHSAGPAPRVACSACEPKPPTAAVPDPFVACSACDPKPPEGLSFMQFGPAAPVPNIL